MEITDSSRLMDPHAYGRDGYPHELWRRLRRESPVHWCESPELVPFWAITKHAHICEVSKQPDKFLSGPGIVPAAQGDRRAHRARRARARSTRCRRSSRWTRPSTASTARSRAPGSRPTRSGASTRWCRRARGAWSTGSTTRSRDGEGTLRLRRPRSRCSTRCASSAPSSACPRRTSRASCASRRSSSPARTPSSSAPRPTASEAFREPRHRVPPVLRQDHRRPPREPARRPRRRARERARSTARRMGDIETLGYYLITFTAGHDTTRNAIAGGMHALVENPARAREAAPRSRRAASPTRSRRSCAGRRR